MTPCFFTRSAGGLTPTDLPLSPWNTGALNGIAVGGLIATLMGEMAPPTETPMHWARLVIDLLGVVPATEIEPRFSILRQGRQMQLLQVELLAGGRVAARGQALRVRIADTPIARTPIAYPAPEALAPSPPQTLGVLRHADHRVVAGRMRTEGPGVLWMRFDYEVVSGVALSPLARATMASDYLAGRGNMMTAEPYSWPNLDISLFLMREPVGDWVLVEAQTESEGDGHGIASGVLADRQGVFAHAHQVVFIERAERLPDHVAL
jgi:hypothetical protein